MLYRLDRIPFVPLNNGLQQLVYAERGASVDTVMIDGRIVMRDGRLSLVDEAALLGEIETEYARLQPAIAEAEMSVARMRPALESIHRRCLCHPIPESTFKARLS